MHSTSPVLSLRGHPLPALPRPSSATLAAPTPVAPVPYPPRHLARCLPYVHSYSTVRPFHTPRIPGVGVSSTHHHSTSSSAASLPPTTPCSTPRLTSHRTRTPGTLLNPTSPPSGNLPITYSASKVRRVSTRPTRHDCVGKTHRLSVFLVCACVGARVNWARWRVRVERYCVFRLSSCVVYAHTMAKPHGLLPRKHTQMRRGRRSDVASFSSSAMLRRPPPPCP
jgi:hypothetical protein